MKQSYGARLVALLALLCLTAGCSQAPAVTITDVTPTAVSSSLAAVVSSQPASSLAESALSSEPPVSSAGRTEGTASAVSGTSGQKQFGYNTNLNIEDNVFMDALLYTGYHMDKHRADGNMWVYILSERKRGLGYLSNITFGGGSTGLETTADGKPDIAAFERGGLVCASFASYVYFNYLPNVAGIDTSCLTRPERTYNAHSFYTAAKDWVKKGYSYSIGFTASRTGEGYIVFRPKQEIPIGSIIVFEDDRKHDGRGSHIVVYAGEKNGYHWVYQVGTKNGPEMCAVERMLFGPDPQWPLAVISTPQTIRMAAMAEVSAVDEAGAPIAGAAVTLKYKKTGETVSLGKTGRGGKTAREGLAYGFYTLSITLPKGYTDRQTTQTVELTPANNSCNRFTVRGKAVKQTVTGTDRAKR